MSKTFKTMKSIYEIKGMSKPRSFTFQTDKEEIFWAKSGLPDDRFLALFNWVDQSEGAFWRQEMFAVIEHDGFSEDGCPLNGVVVSLQSKIEYYESLNH